MRTIIQQIHYELEISGLKPGTDEFMQAERKERVRRCKELKNLSTCWDCPAFDNCTTIKGHLCDLYRVKT